MKRLATLALAALLGLGCASAQKKGDRPQPPTAEEQVAELKTQLSLTDEQTEKITTLFTENEAKMKDAREKTREEMRAEREELDKQVQALLTKDQQKTYQELQSKRGPKGGPKGGPQGNRGKGPKGKSEK